MNRSYNQENTKDAGKDLEELIICFTLVGQQLEKSNLGKSNGVDRLKESL